MEHLVKNTYHERITTILENINEQNQINLENEIQKLIDKIVDVAAAMFAAIVAGIVVNIISKVEKICNIGSIILMVIVVGLMIVLYLIWHKIRKRKTSGEEKIEERKINIEKSFNTKIIQKIAEVHEALGIAESTDNKDCCMLNVILSMYNMNHIINFFCENLNNKIEIRHYINKGSSKVFSRKINGYTVEMLVLNLQTANDKIGNLIQKSEFKNLKDYDLLQADYKWIKEEIEILYEKNVNEQEQEALLSVIVPVYNIEAYIGKCLESIINQTYKNLEIILVDDGSTDSSGRICDKYAKNDKRIKVIHKQNGGLVSARKAGIIEASGAYATYVDGDDWIEQDMYEKLIKRIYGADIIISGVYRDYSNGSVQEQHKIADGDYEGKELETIYRCMVYNGRFFERGIQPHVVNCLFKTDVLLKSQIKVSDEIRVGEDAACLYPAMLDAKRIVIINKSYYHYVMRENSIMGVNDNHELERYKILYAHLKKSFHACSVYSDILLEQLRYFMVYVLLLKEIDILQNKKYPFFPYENMNLKAKVIVCGKGRFGKEYVNYLLKSKILEVGLWADSSEKDKIQNYIIKEHYDYVIVAVLVKEIVDEIIVALHEIGIENEKIRYIKEENIKTVFEQMEHVLN